MRKSLLALLAAGLAFAAGSPARAITASLSGSILEIQIGLSGGLPTASFSQGSPLVPMFVSSGGGSFTEPASVFTGTQMFATPSVFSPISLLSSLDVTVANGTKVITPSGGPGGGFGGPGPLFGNVRMGVLGGLINLSIPLSVVGSPGASVMGGAATLMITVTGTGWTTGPAVVTGVTTGTTGPSSTPLLGTVVLTGSDNRTPTNHLGPITLVTGARVITNAVGTFPLFAVQRLNFVPEPGAFLLLGAGAAVLVALGRRRR